MQSTCHFNSKITNTNLHKINESPLLLDVTQPFKFDTQLQPVEAKHAFQYPYFIAISEQTNHLFVSNCCKHRIDVFNERGRFVTTLCESNGRIVRGDVAKYNYKVVNPLGISTFQKDKILVADQSTHRVLIFKATSCVLLRVITRFNQLAFGSIRGIISANKQNKIIVADHSNKRTVVMNPFNDNGYQVNSAATGLSLVNEELFAAAEVKHIKIYTIETGICLFSVSTINAAWEIVVCPIGSATYNTQTKLQQQQFLFIEATNSPKELVVNKYDIAIDRSVNETQYNVKQYNFADAIYQLTYPQNKKKIKTNLTATTKDSTNKNDIKLIAHKKLYREIVGGIAIHNNNLYCSAHDRIFISPLF